MSKRKIKQIVTQEELNPTCRKIEISTNFILSLAKR